MNSPSKLAIVILPIVSATFAQADPIEITTLIGDKDCFGFGGVCAEGDPVPVFFNNRGPEDPLGTDQWDTSVPLGGPIFAFLLDLDGATPLSASLTTFTAGIELVGATFYFNGTNIGFYTEPEGLENRAAAVVFDVPTSLLSDVNTIFLDVADLGFVQDGFAIDYLELSVWADDDCDDDDDCVPVPEPSTIALFALGLFGLGIARRRRA